MLAIEILNDLILLIQKKAWNNKISNQTSRTQHHGWLIKSCTTRDARKPKNDGMTYVPTGTSLKNTPTVPLMFWMPKIMAMKHWGLLPSTCAPVYSSCLIVENMHLKRNSIIYVYIDTYIIKIPRLPLTHFMPDLVLRQETSPKSKQWAKRVARFPACHLKPCNI